MKIDAEDMVAVPVMPKTTEAMIDRLSEAKEIVDSFVESGDVDPRMRDFYLGWAYANPDGLAGEWGDYWVNLPIPEIKYELIEKRYVSSEALLVNVGDVTPWKHFGGSFDVDITGDDDTVVVFDRSFDGGKTFHSVMSGGKILEIKGPLEDRQMVTGFCDYWRLRLAASEGGKCIASISQH